MLTLVVDGVPEAEDASNEPDEGRARRVLAVEELRLDASRGLCGYWALGKLGVKVDQGRKAGSRARRLSQKASQKCRNFKGRGYLQGGRAWRPWVGRDHRAGGV